MKLGFYFRAHPPAAGGFVLIFLFHAPHERTNYLKDNRLSGFVKRLNGAALGRIYRVKIKAKITAKPHIMLGMPRRV
jgi:hypothetical protein